MAAPSATSPMSAMRRGGAVGVGRSPTYRMSPMVEGMDMDRLEPDMADSSLVQPADGRCSCCPYGYHIDVDFLQYLDSMKDGNYLKNLKKIHRNKKKLRKSMEVFLQQQERVPDSSSAPPPDVVHNTANFINMVEYEDSATNKILDEIDTSVNATLSSIDHLMHTGKKDHSQSSTSYEDDMDSLRSPSAGSSWYGRDQRYRTETQMKLQSPGPYMGVLGKSDSVSSLDSQSTYSSDPNVTTTHSYHNGQDVKTTTKTTTTYHKFVTSDDLENNMTELLPRATSPRVYDPNHEVDPTTLTAIREQMAISLQRMRDLEEQVKAIPVLQVRISVLKEEKRLLSLQLQAKNKKFNMRSIGVGESRVDEPDPLWGPPLGYRSPSPTGRSFEYSQFSSSQSSRVRGEPPQVPPKPRVASRSIGLGDGNVFDNYQLQTIQGGAPPGGSRFHEKELHSEQSTHIHEKEIKTVFLGGQQLDEIDSKMSSLKQRRTPPKTAPKPKMRNIGVGDGNVFDTSSSMHVHEKEVRTVYIGESEQNKKATRNVGILCKAAMRDVGVTYMYDNSPNTRNIAVGVGEIGVGDMEGKLGIMAEGEEGEGGTMSQSVINQLTTMQQLNMAAFHTKHIHIKNEHLRVILDEILKKTVHSVGVQVRFATEDKGVNHVGYNKIDVGCGDKDMSIDVEVKPIVAMKSVAIDNRPSMFSRSAATDRLFTSDFGTNTMNQKVEAHRATMTDKTVTYPAATNTEIRATHSISTDTDMKIFQALDQVKNTGVNTHRPTLVESAVNTMSTRMLDDQNFDMNISFRNKTSNTERSMGPKRTTDRGINTQPIRQYDKGINTQKVMQWDKASVTDKPQVFIASTNTDPRLFPSTEVEESQVTSTTSRVVQGEVEQRRVSPKSSSIVTETVRTTRIGGDRDKSTSSSKEDISSTKARAKHSISVGIGDGPVLDSSPAVHIETRKERSPSGRVTTYESRTSTVKGSSPGVHVETSSERSPSGRVMSYETRTERSQSSRPGVTSTYEITPKSPTSDQSQFSETLETVRTSEVPGYQSNYEVTRSVPGGYRSEIRTTREVSRSGGEPKTMVSSYEITPSSSRRNETHTTTKTVRSSEDTPSSVRTTEIKSRRRSPERTQTISKEAMLSGSDSGGTTVRLETSPSGATQMRVMRHVETTYVGDNPVKRSVEWTGSDGDWQQSGKTIDDGTTTTTTEQDGTVTTERVTKISPMQDSGINVEDLHREERTETRLPSGGTRRTYVTETRVERAGADSYPSESSLKSIIKKDSGPVAAKQKKEISFSEDTLGGYVSSSSSEAEEDRQEVEEEEIGGEEEAEGSGSEGSQSSVSYDEGSYDGRLGQIVYTCKDDEAIEQGEEGAQMFDQNVRETFELSEEMHSACQVYALWLEDSTQVNTKQLNSSLNEIQQEWFKISSLKTSSPEQVEDYLSCFNEISRDLLEHVVNMADANGNTALHYAVSHCNMEVSNLLMDSEVCDINKENKAGYTAIMLASLAQLTTDIQKDIVHKMFEMGDVNARASQAGQTALMLAVSHGKQDMVASLLECGADVNTQDEDGSTALMCASEHGHLEIVKLLLASADCDATLADNDGSTALSIAMETGHRDIGVLLYAHVNFKQASPVMSSKKITKTVRTPIEPLSSSTSSSSSYRSSMRSRPSVGQSYTSSSRTPFVSSYSSTSRTPHVSYSSYSSSTRPVSSLVGNQTSTSTYSSGDKQILYGSTSVSGAGHQVPLITKPGGYAKYGPKSTRTGTHTTTTTRKSDRKRMTLAETQRGECVLAPKPLSVMDWSPNTVIETVMLPPPPKMICPESGTITLEMPFIEKDM